MSKKDRVGSRGSPGVPRASLQSSRRVWGCFREDLECLGGPWVGSVVFWKGLKMSQECLGVSKVCSCGSGGSWSHPEGSGDVPERPWRVQRVLLLIHWGPQIHPEASGDVQEGSCRVQWVSRCAQSILAVIQKGLGMSQRGLGGSGRSLGGFCCPLEGSEDVPDVSWVSKGCCH